MTKTVRFIGDIHGKYAHYLKRIVGVPESVQVGDYGFGFSPASFIDEIYEFAQGSHRMIRGNHDDPDEALKSKHFIPDGTVEGNVMYIGGAASIDRAIRTEGVNWWAGEESSEEALELLIQKYAATKPEILVTHEVSDLVATRVMIPAVNGLSNFRSRTREAFDRMYAISAPRLHIFGHWHIDMKFRYGLTDYICLNELSFVDIEVEE